MARFTQGGGSGEGSALNYSQQAGTSVTVNDAGAVITGVEMMTTGKPVQISVTGEAANNTAGSWIIVQLHDSNTPIGNAIQLEASAVSENVPYALNFIYTAEAGGHDFNLKVVSKSPGTWVFGEAGGPVFNAVELTGFKGDTGATGLTGADGSDALWNFTGPYNGGASYAVGDIATYNGETWYRVNSNGGNVGDTPSEGLWTLVAQKGADGTSGSGGVVYLGNYVSGNGYIANIAVVRGSDNNLYIAKSNGGLADPVGNTAEWDIFSENTTGGITVDIADFIFTNDENDTGRSIISLPGDKGMTIAAGVDSDLYLTAGDDLYIQTLGTGDDIFIQAADDIRFTAGNENIEVRNWIMNSEGEFHLPGDGYISNPLGSSGDGYGNDTLHLVPDESLGADQHIIIDPTAPNHIHIRAGGVQDASTAHLILGGERNNVEVSDPYRTVKINTKPNGIENTYANSNEASNTQFIHASGADIIVGDTVRLYTGGPTYVVDNVTQEYPGAGLITVTAPGLSFISGEAYLFTRDQGYNNQWTFGNDGVLSGPAMGGIWVESIQKKSVEYGLGIYSPVDIVLEASNGEFLNDSSNPANQIATIGNINDTVSNGMVRYSPTFEATGLTFTGSDGTHPTYNSYYVKAGKMVTFAIEVDCATVTNFGTGQYKLQLPFTPAIGFNHFSGWAHVDTAVNPDVTNGHIILNVDHAGVTDVLDLHYLKQAGGANSGIIEGIFLQGTPVTLTTSSKIYVNGTYIAQ